MERVLVVIDTESSRELLSEAAECTKGTNVELVLLSFISEDGFRQDQETLERIASAEHTSFDSDAPVNAARRFAADVGGEVLGANAEFETVGAVADDDEQAEYILATAEEEGCDHVFLTGRRRSPTGKVLFGDRAQEVILNFDGLVTVSME